MVGVVATVVALVIGVAYGAVAGFFGGKVDSAALLVPPAAPLTWASSCTIVAARAGIGFVSVNG